MISTSPYARKIEK